MRHVDATDVRETGSTPSMTTIYFFSPYENINSAGGGSTLSSFPNVQTPTAATSSASLINGSNSDNNDGSSLCGGGMSTFSTVKPTLDYFQIRFCPEENWLPDRQVITCMGHECNVSFSFFNRRHHCRLCGRIFCAACCSHIITQRGSHQADSHVSQPPALTDASGSSHLLGSLSSCNIGKPSEERGAAAAVVSNPPSPLYSNSNINANNIQHEQRPLKSCSKKLAPQVSQLSPAATTATTATPTVTTTTTTTTTHRICSSCYYEIQLVVPRRNHNGQVWRKCRGELKMLQSSILVRMLSYLSMRDLFEVSLVSSDFYFISRDNVIWYQYNMAQRREETELPFSINTTSSPILSQRQRVFGRQKLFQGFKSDIEDITTQDVARSAVSLHARYNFTQFLDFVQRKEMARCRGLASFHVCSRLLLSSPLKIAIIGPPRVGKTLLVQRYVGLQKYNDQSFNKSLSTMGFKRYEKTVHLEGFLTADVNLCIYDLSGEQRFEKLRQFICSYSHAIGLCYDPRRKTTLVEAADIMMGVESALGAQPVVVCGITCNEGPAGQEKETEVTEVEASGITVRGEGSLHCSWCNGEVLFQQIVQALLFRLSMATAAVTSGPCAASDKREIMRRHKVAEGLLQITLEPSPLDLLVD